MAIKFTCPKCNEVIISKFLKPGDEMDCPFCMADTVVPADVTETTEAPNINRTIPNTGGTHTNIDNVQSKANVETAHRELVDKTTLNRNFNTLLTFGSVISSAGWIIVAIAVIGIFVSFTLMGSLRYVGILIAVLTAASGMVIVSYGQLISCFVSIERNTHATFRALQKESGK